MTTITILPEEKDSYRAVAGDKESTGRTAGEALDALTAQLTEQEGRAFIVMLNRNADEFFTAAQQQRLGELMRLREAGTLSPTDAQELAALIEAELDGARRRALASLDGLRP